MTEKMLVYELKIYPNKKKELALNNLISFWRDQVNHHISIFWDMDITIGSFPPKELMGRGRLGVDYKQLANRMEHLAPLKCFQVTLVDPRDTSRTCPECGSVSEENRHGERFHCKACGFEAHADVVGAINIGRKSIREHSSPKKLLRGGCYDELS